MRGTHRTLACISRNCGTGRKIAGDPLNSFPGHGQLKPEQLEIARLKREVIKLKAERDILRKLRPTSRRNRREVLLHREAPGDLVMAIWRRGKPDALLHHPDRGSQYSSEQIQRLMADHGGVCSVSRSGNVWDDAAMESFFSPLKTERTAAKMYRSRDDAKADVFDYIERSYNAKRRHSTIGYLSPMEFERRAGFA